MREMFQTALMHLALCGLAASVALLVLRSRLVRDAFARLMSAWRSLMAFGRFAVCSFLLIGILIGGDKTNNVPTNMNSPLPQMVGGGVIQGGAASCRAGDLRNGSFTWRGGTPHLLGTLPNSGFAEWKSSTWNICGAWKDSFWLPFEDGWMFPHGSNHLSGVEVVSQGMVWPTPFDKNAIASIGTPVEIVRGLTTFEYEFTTSNSYRFVWSNAAINRDTNNLVSAALELFRNGDVSITTNGVAAHLPRELPFAHDGFGQDDAWVAANFTNATEILAIGYPQWVDSQVGTGLTNGLYKLTVAVADDPPETTLVSVGDLSIAVTNAGDYVFLLGKGIRYDLSASSECATNFVYSALDDIVCHTRFAAGGLRLQVDGGQEGVWSSDSGELRLFWPFEFVEWKPTLSISPRKWNPSRANAVRSFTATLTDIPWFVSPSYTWSSADSSVCTCDGAQDRTATFTCKFPAAYGSGVSLALDVMLNQTTLHADYWRYIGYFSESEDYEDSIVDCDDCGPNPGLVVCASPSVVFFEKGTANATSAEVGCYYQVSGAGTFELTVSGDVVSVTDQAGASVSSGYTWETDGGVVGARHFFAERSVKSTSPSGTVFTVTFTPDEGTNTLSGTDSVTFVEWVTETKATWPSDRRRKTIGVCEVVNITIDPRIPNLNLSTASPESSLRLIANGHWKYAAPERQLLDEVIAPGFGSILQFNILAPTGYISNLKTIEVTANNAPGVSGGYAMKFDLVVLPTNVSFYAIKIREVGMTAVNVTGYFAEPRNSQYLAHSASAGANSWATVYRGNKSSDRAQIAVLSPPWGIGGGMKWPIPNEYTGHVANTSGIYFCNTDQEFAVDLAGTARLEKFGWFAEVTTNRVFSYGRNATP